MHSHFLFIIFASLLLSGCFHREIVYVEDDAPRAKRGFGIMDAVDDRRLTAAVKMKLLADNDVGGMGIDVDTFNDVVVLKGAVDSRAEAIRALRLARSVPGVRSVRSQLAVVR